MMMITTSSSMRVKPSFERLPYVAVSLDHGSPSAAPLSSFHASDRVAATGVDAVLSRRLSDQRRFGPSHVRLQQSDQYPVCVGVACVRLDRLPERGLGRPSVTSLFLSLREEGQVLCIRVQGQQLQKGSPQLWPAPLDGSGS